MEDNDIYDLLKKYRANKCSDEEKVRILEWYSQFEKEADRMPVIPQEKLDQLWYSVENKLTIKPIKRWKHIISHYAAVSIIFIVVAVGFYFHRDANEIMPESTIKKELLPAKGVAVLELSDGRQVSLAKVSEIKDREGVLIKNDGMKMLDYSLAKAKKIHSEYNTIKVPIGGEYQVMLSDGTKVHLNSCSSLRYPVPFSGELREVELIGEAYFEVAKGQKPFIVKTSDIDVRVLGTTFNVSGYQEDNQVTATLLEGQVVVKDHYQPEEYMIKPGMTLSYSKNGKQVELKEIDPELYISWLQGKFVFEDMRLEDIMIKLNRWYDCRIEYEDELLKDFKFTGAAEKDRPASYLLEMIELVTDVRFEVTGNVILVKRK